MEDTLVSVNENEREAMKQHFILILLILVLALGVLIWYAQEGNIPPKVETLPQPDAGLIEFQQMKLTQLDELNKELGDLQVNIDEKGAEVQRLNTLIDEAYKRISELVGHPVYPGEPVGMHLLASEEIIAMLKIDTVNSELSQLWKQESCLLAIKQYLEQDIKEIQQHTKLENYYKFKLSQLDDLNARLVELRIDIDQKTLLGEEFASVQQEYNDLLIQRQHLQQDIEQLEQLLEED